MVIGERIRDVSYFGNPANCFERVVLLWPVHHFNDSLKFLIIFFLADLLNQFKTKITKSRIYRAIHQKGLGEVASAVCVQRNR